MIKKKQNEKEFCEKRIKYLKNLINKYNDEYYGSNNPIFNEYECDKLVSELIDLEKKFPEFKTSDSPTQKVGGLILKGFKKIKHKYKMLSLLKIFSFDEVYEFDKKIKNKLGLKIVDYMVELKIDGLAMALNYVNSELNYAATRGDGFFGEDVTKNVMNIDSIPKKIKFNKNIEIRGEIFISKENLRSINNERLKKGEFLFANSRNAAAGSIRQLNSKMVETRKLDGFWYYFVNASDFGIKKHSDSLNFIEKLGFKVNSERRVCHGVEEIINYINEYYEKRDNLPYDIDGIVIKVDDFKYYDVLGYTSKTPKWAIAYKFPPKKAFTTIRDIIYFVGRTGRITPIAVFDPINISGSLISKATLHNEDFIQTKKIAIGKKVVVFKAGDIIPEIINVVDEKDQTNVINYKKIENCPKCGSKLVKIRSIHYCFNPDCEAKKIRNLIYFVSQPAMEISGLGKNIIEQFFNYGFIKTIPDIYKLKRYEKEILLLDGWSNKSFDNLINSIEKSKNNPLEKLLIALGINHVSNKIIKILSKKFPDINDWKKIEKEELISIRDIGPIIANSIYDYFHNSENLKMLLELKELGLNFKFSEIKNELKNNFFSSKNIVLTGIFLKYKRKELKEKLENFGAKITEFVSKNVDLVIVGNKPGSKFDKAKKMNLEILSENKFMDLLNKIENK